MTTTPPFLPSKPVSALYATIFSALAVPATLIFISRSAAAVAGLNLFSLWIFALPIATLAGVASAHWMAKGPIGRHPLGAFLAFSIVSILLGWTSSVFGQTETFIFLALATLNIFTACPAVILLIMLLSPEGRKRNH